MKRERRLAMSPKASTWRIEAPGCFIYIMPAADGEGTTIDVVPDGDRFTRQDERSMTAKVAKPPSPGSLALRVKVDRT
jgi:hypothetical protein